MAGWAIPMGEQVSVEARLQRHRDARDAVMGRRCYCPDDCRCRREDNPPCGCRQHELRKHGADAVGEDYPRPSRVTPTGPGHVTGLQHDPSNEPCLNGPRGDHVWTNRNPLCRYCGTDMRGPCCGDPADCNEPCNERTA